MNEKPARLGKESNHQEREAPKFLPLNSLQGWSFFKQVSQRKVMDSDTRKKRSPPYYLVHL